MTNTTIFACPDVRGPQWQLGPLPPVEGQMTLIGWRQTPCPIDGGVPKEVATVLARALTSVARVTFPCSIESRLVTASWSTIGGDLGCVLACKSVMARVNAKLRGIPPGIALISTRRVDSSMRLFQDAGYPWCLQGQVVLLSKADAAPPCIDRKKLLALYEEDWARQAVGLAEFGVIGILKPGVDGDVAGLLSLSEGFDQYFISTLEHEAQIEGFDWAIMSKARL